MRSLKDLAASQLGTVGSGNHYVDIFKDEEGYVWIGVHFGSRGLGHKSTTHFLSAAGGKDGMMVDPCVVEMQSEIGQAYLDAMRLAGRYAYAGREWVCDEVSHGRELFVLSPGARRGATDALRDVEHAADTLVVHGGE